MAKKTAKSGAGGKGVLSGRQRTPQPPPDDDDDDDLDLELADGAAARDEIEVDQELQELEQELGEDSSIRVVVHRVIANGESQRCFACPRSQFFSDQIPAKWGPGTYKVMAYSRGKLAKRYLLSFAEPLQASTSSSSAPASDAVTVRDLEARFEARLEREQQRNFDMLKLLTESRGAAAVDPLQAQRQTLEMLATVRELSGGKNTDRDPIELVLEGVKLAQRLGGEGGGSADWPGAIVEAAQALRSISREDRPPRPALPAPAPGGGTPNKTNPPAELAGEEEDMEAKLRKVLQFLLKKAAAGRDPELYAEVAIDALDELPQLVAEIAVAYLKREDCLEQLIRLEPSIAQHREWFTACVGEIRQLLSPPEGTSDLTPAEGTGDPDA